MLEGAKYLNLFLHVKVGFKFEKINNVSQHHTSCLYQPHAVIHVANMSMGLGCGEYGLWVGHYLGVHIHPTLS